MVKYINLIITVSLEYLSLSTYMLLKNTKFIHHFVGYTPYQSGLPRTWLRQSRHYYFHRCYLWTMSILRGTSPFTISILNLIKEAAKMQAPATNQAILH